MLTPLALFLGLLVATAFIAHWSDNLGKKLGKKRVSVFGLRPRTSATVLTVVSSWAIMGFTLLALLLAVAPLKTALFSIDMVRGQLVEVTRQLKTSKEQLPVVQKQLVGTQRQLEQTQGEVENAKKQTLVAQKQVVVFQKDASKYQGEAKKSRGEAEKARREFEKAKAGEQSARSSAQAARQQQQQAIASLANVRTELQSSRVQVRQTQSELTTNQAQLRQAESNVKQAGLVLKQRQAQLKQAESRRKQAEQRRVQATRAAFQAGQAAFRVGAQKLALDRQVLALKREAQTLQASNREARELALFNGQLAENSLFGTVSDISLPVDQTLSEHPIDANLSSTQIETELQGLIDASQNAVQRFVPEAKVVARVFEPDPKSGKKVALTQQQTVESYARALSLANVPVSARLVSAFNYPGDARQVFARFSFVPMRTIYAAQQTIYDGAIDGTKTESAIFGDLQRLVDQARIQAVKHGSSPPLSPENKNFFDGDTGPKLFDALRKIQRLGHPVPVRIVAARDLDATEPLQIRFQIGEPGAT